VYARNTNDRPHPEAACRVGRETLVPGGNPSRFRGSRRERRDESPVACPGWPRVIAPPKRGVSGGDVRHALTIRVGGD